MRFGTYGSAMLCHSKELQTPTYSHTSKSQKAQARKSFKAESVLGHKFKSVLVTTGVMVALLAPIRMCIRMCICICVCICFWYMFLYVYMYDGIV